MMKTDFDTLLCKYLQKRSTFELNKDISKRLTEFLNGKKITLNSIDLDFKFGEHVNIIVERPYEDFFLKALRDAVFQCVNMCRVDCNNCLDDIKSVLSKQKKEIDIL